MSTDFCVRVKLTIPDSLVRTPVVAHLVRDFDVTPDIRRADISESVGWIVCEIDGEQGNVDRALEWLRSQGVGVDLLGDVLES
jgi:hypothetical protein